MKDSRSKTKTIRTVKAHPAHWYWECPVCGHENDHESADQSSRGVCEECETLVELEFQF